MGSSCRSTNWSIAWAASLKGAIYGGDSADLLWYSRAENVDTANGPIADDIAMALSSNLTVSEPSTHNRCGDPSLSLGGGDRLFIDDGVIRKISNGGARASTVAAHGHQRAPSKHAIFRRGSPSVSVYRSFPDLPPKAHMPCLLAVQYALLLAPTAPHRFI